jgi:glycosyltransferase involved in cell wall biosynthesis
MQEVANWMAESDLLVVPSIWLENSPGVVIQALGVSLPVMGSDKGGIPELITNGENGVLVPPGDVAAWRAAFKAILDDPSRLDTYRSNAGRRFSEFDQDTIGKRVVAFFETIRALPEP